MGACPHVLALLNGPLALVQPLGVTAVVFAVPVAAALYRHRGRIREMAAAATVATGLCGLLFVIPTDATSLVPAGVSTAVITAGIAWLARSPVHRARIVDQAAIRT